MTGEPLEYVVVRPQIEGNPQHGYEHVYYSDLGRWPSREAAIRHGWRTQGHDDWLLAHVRGDQLVMVSWQHEDRPDEHEERAAIAEAFGWRLTLTEERDVDHLAAALAQALRKAGLRDAAADHERLQVAAHEIQCSGWHSLQLARADRRTREHLDELEAAVDRVRRLHSQPVDFLEPGRWCPACGEEVPCPTIRALNGTETIDHA